MVIERQLRPATTKCYIELLHTYDGFLREASGGTAYADVIEENVGPDRIVRKHITGLRYEDIKVSFGPNMGDEFFKWLKEGFNGKLKKDLMRRTGALVRLDTDDHEIGRLAFENAILSELTIPGLNASGKEPVYFDLTMIPGSTTLKHGHPGGKVNPPLKGHDSYLASNFTIDIPTCTNSCKKVSKVDPIRIKQQIFRDRGADEQKDFAVELGALEYSHLGLTVAEAHADEFYKWFEDFVIKGNNDQDMERNGTLTFLGSDLKRVLFKLKLNNLGIFRIEPAKEDGPEPARRVKVQMYVENLEIEEFAKSR